MSSERPQAKELSRYETKRIYIRDKGEKKNINYNRETWGFPSIDRSGHSVVIVHRTDPRIKPRTTTKIKRPRESGGLSESRPTL